MDAATGPRARKGASMTPRFILRRAAAPAGDRPAARFGVRGHFVLTALIASLGMVLGTVTYALAGHQEANVVSITGCLVGGKLKAIAIGDSPASPCGSNDTVHLSGGDITAVRAGSGLSGGGENGAVSLAVDLSTVQSRVVGSCGGRLGDASISEIHQDGSVTCNPDDVGETPAYAGFLDTGPDLECCGHFHTVALEVPPGSYVINAKVGLIGILGGCCLSNEGALGFCKLFTSDPDSGTGLDSDLSPFIIPSTGASSVINETTTPLQLVQTFAQGSAIIYVGCQVDSMTHPDISLVHMEQVKVTAVAVDSLSTVDLAG